MSFFEDASLVLIPSGIKNQKIYSVKPTDGSGDLTFSRASNATRVGPDGLIEKVRTNLLLQSNQFDTTWTNTDTTETGGQSGYDGTSDAWLLEKSAASGRITQNNTNSGVQTFSVYAKAGTLNWMRLITIRAAGGSPRADFNLSSGAVGTTSNNIDATIESIGGGWHRCTITADVALTEVRIYPAEDNNDVSGTSGNIFIQDAQLEQGLVATEYQETTTTSVSTGPVSGLPRLDYLNSSCPRLLLEGQRTNLVPISDSYPQSVLGVSLTYNYGTSPEGVQNSLKAQKSGGTGNDRFYPISTYNATISNGTTYTISGFLKNIDVASGGVTTISCRVSGGTLFRLGFEWNGTSLSIASTQASGTRSNEFIESYGNDWYRVGFSFVADGTTANYEIDIDRENASDTTSIESYGWQFESGNFVSSYIPTYGTSVTRVADAASKTGISSLIGQTEGTLFVEVDTAVLGDIYGGNNRRFLTISDGTTNNRIVIAQNRTTDAINLAVITSASLVADISTGSNQSGIKKIGVAYANNDFVMYVNGVQIGTDTSGGVPPCSRLGVGVFETDASNFNAACPIAQALLFKTRLTNAQLAELTTL